MREKLIAQIQTGDVGLDELPLEAVRRYRVSLHTTANAARGRRRGIIRLLDGTPMRTITRDFF